MLIVYRLPPEVGWHPVTCMVQLAAELFQAELLVLREEQPPTLTQKLSAVLPRQRGNESCLLVCAGPMDLRFLLCVEDWRRRFRQIAAWVIDSFWLEELTRFGKHSRAFDRFFITSAEDVPEWSRQTKTPTSWLPWGADVLRLGTEKTERRLDLLRVGRQPPEWEDDAISERACQENGLRFQGRPPGYDDPMENQRLLMELYGQSKFLLAFSNKANPAPYTHPRREYLTARWTDALACGAVVAGIAPKEPSIEQLLWPGATLELGTIRREEGMRIVSEAVRDWRPEQARKNYTMALERLDWRWRFAVLAEELGESPPRLEAELRLLRQTVESRRPHPVVEKS